MTKNEKQKDQNDLIFQTDSISESGNISLANLSKNKDLKIKK